MSKHEDEAHDLIFPDAPSMASKPSDYDQCFYPVTGYRYGKISTACNGTRKYHADNPISFNHPFTGPPDTEGLREPSKVAWVLEDQDCPHEPLVDKDHPKGDVCRRCNNYIKKAQPDRELTDARGALLLVADKCVAYENALREILAFVEIDDGTWPCGILHVNPIEPETDTICETANEFLEVLSVARELLEPTP